MIDSAEKPVSLLARHPWLVFVLPLLVYMVLGQFEPSPQPTAPQDDAAHSESDTKSGTGFAGYPLAYTLKLALTLGALAFVFPVYRAFPRWIHKWSIPIGVFGGIFWILVCRLKLEVKLWQLLQLATVLKPLGIEGPDATRPMFDPFSTFQAGSWGLWAFLGIRLLGLVVIVPLIEEFFLRGFLIRFITKAEWLKLPIGEISGAGFAVMLLYAVGTHPGEMIAAALWFSMVTMFVMQTKNIWDAVCIHAVTNLVLGIYILVWQDWTMW